MSTVDVLIVIGLVLSALGVAHVGISTFRAIERNQQRAEWYWAQKYYALRDELENRE